MPPSALPGRLQIYREGRGRGHQRFLASYGSISRDGMKGGEALQASCMVPELLWQAEKGGQTHTHQP